MDDNQKEIEGHVEEKERLSNYMALAEGYLKQDESNKAVAILRDYSKYMKDKYGSEGFESIWALRNCAILLGQNEKFTESEPFLREILEKTTGYSNLSTEDIDESTEDSDESTEDIDGSTEDSDESTEDIDGSTEDSDESTEDIDGSTDGMAEYNKFTRWARYALAFCLMKTKKLKEACRIFKDVLNDQKQALGEKDLDTVEITKYYLQSLLESRRAKEATRLLEDCSQVIETLDDSDSYEVKMELLKIGYVLIQQRRYKPGQDFVQEVLWRQADLFGLQHPETVKMAETAFYSIREMAYGRVKASVPSGALILRNRWNAMKEILGVSHKDTLLALEELADLVWHTTESSMEQEGALMLSQKVYDGRRETLGEDHRDTISARKALRSRMEHLKYSDISSILGDEPAESADVMEDVDCAHSVSCQSGEADDEEIQESTTPESRNPEYMDDSHDSRNTDQLCEICSELHIASFLGNAQVWDEEQQDSSYPRNNQTVQSLRSRGNCPLCRLISERFSTLLNSDGLDPNTRISYRYIWPDILDRNPDSGFDGEGHVRASMLLLEVSMQDEKCLLYAVDTRGGAIERVEAVANISLNVNSSSPSKNSLSVNEHGLLPALSLILRGRRDEARNKLALLGETYGYLKGRLVDEVIDTSLIKSWIHCCDSHHGKKCKPIGMDEHSHWRSTWLIDVHKGMLVPGDEGGTSVSYAALSYVWGEGGEQLKHTATDGMADKLKSPGSLTQSSKLKIPKTIKDAIELCRQIGIPYLWVDAICLDQDNITDDILNSMGKLYQGASVTIIAASGEHSNAGICGFSLNSKSKRPKPDTWNIDNMSVGLYSDSAQNMIQDSNWYKRAWTFQEMLLSKRLLIFTEKEVFYQCASGIAWRESVFLEHPQLLSAGFSIVGAECQFRLISIIEKEVEDGQRKDWIRNIYRGLVSGYLHRKLTEPSDVLKAVQGILTIMAERTKQSFYKGIPTEDAFRSLLFHVTRAHDNIRRPNFPSWSWCGWQNISMTDDPNKSALKFVEDCFEYWFKPKVDLYRFASSQNYHNDNNIGRIYYFSAIDTRNKKTGQIKIDDNVDAGKKADWEREAHNMLVFLAETMQVEAKIENPGEPVSQDPKILRHRILSPKLGLRFLDLEEKSWTKMEDVRLEFVAFAEAKAFGDDPKHLIEPTDTDKLHFVKSNWQNHLVAQIAVLLVEKNPKTNISRRLGLYTDEPHKAANKESGTLMRVHCVEN
ncbi:hypothetical protein AYL99_07136 [Fonsecaea erecta]|uniref:Heterokaryon incompatibility domain-containing protein n=1 Tax=Fonsecaea erecta TaxID=1367422 RepID=A0A178ZEZ0_9EURO|nr:hypothetical protein AYL99_07136 [Fonsecaea erecta]OAP58046.1 hypothetical protein AYL99_07136 [Fonsecaea erecta]